MFSEIWAVLINSSSPFELEYSRTRNTAVLVSCWRLSSRESSYFLLHLPAKNFRRFYVIFLKISSIFHKIYAKISHKYYASPHCVSDSQYRHELNEYSLSILIKFALFIDNNVFVTTVYDMMNSYSSLSSDKEETNS